jgi:fucose permease
VGAYLLAALSPLPLLGLVGCGLCGLSVGILWPGTYNLAASRLRGGGTAMFALLALGGDLGCAGGPALVGMISDRFGGALRVGLMGSTLFPLLLLVGLLLLRKKKKIG